MERTSMAVKETVGSGEAKGTGDLILLKNLCAEYGLSDIAKRLEKGDLPLALEKGKCPAGRCSSGCTFVCMECYVCPPDCVAAQ